MRPHFLSLFYFIILIYNSLSLNAQDNIYNRAIIKMLNGNLLEADLVLDSALQYEDYQSSANAWFRKGELTFKMLQRSKSSVEKLSYVSKAIHSFERVKFLDSLGSIHYQQANDYLSKVWETCIKEALEHYDRGEFKITIQFCNNAKEIYPEDLNAYLYAGKAADELNDLKLLKENYYRLIHAGYYRAQIFDRLIEIEKQSENDTNTLWLLNLAAKNIQDKEGGYLKEKITFLQNKNAWLEAEKAILDSDIHLQQSIEFKLLLAKNYLSTKKFKETKKIIYSIEPQTEKEKLLTAEIYHDLALNMYIDRGDKDGNKALKKHEKQLLEQARWLFESITFTRENCEKLTERLVNIEGLIKKSNQ